MSKLNKKFVSAALTLTTSVWMSGAMLLVPVAHAQSTADLQAQIAALLAQIQQLQAQLNASQGGTSSYSFTRDLTVGSRGDDVSALQQILISGGYLTAVSAPTGYFGSLTQAALAKWQAAKGVSPTAGYFGPKTRAAIASVGGVTPPPSGGGPVVAPASGLSVTLSASNPVAGSIISGATTAARIPVFAVDLTAGTASGVTVQTLKFTKQGVLSDTAVSSAYLIESGKVVAQYSSLSSGVISFNGLNLSIAAGQRRTFALAIDPAANLSAGNTVSFYIRSADDITAVDAANNTITESGTFPVSGSIFTVTTVSNPSIAVLTISSSSVGGSVYAGTQNVLVSQWSPSVGNSPVNLASLNFKVIGSANKGDIKNVKLFINGSQVGSTLAQVGADGSAYFDLTGSPARLNTGTSNLQVYADIMGSPSFDFRFELLNSYDVYAVDTQYNVPVSVTVTGGSGALVTILQGTITVSLASDTPTGNVAKGGSGTALGKFTVYAAGEPVKVKFLDYRLTFTGTAADASSTIAVIANQVKNITLVDDAGVQVGTTMNTPTNTDSTACANTAGVSNMLYTNCFGTNASNINYIVPANTTRVLSLRADIQSTATFSTIQALLLGNSLNLQGQISSQTGSSGAVNGSALTLAANALTVAKESSFGNQTYAKGKQNAKIASFVLRASSAEGVNVANMTVRSNASSTNFQNLKLRVGSTQYGITQGTLSNDTDYTFSGNLTVPAGGSITVDAYADILSTNTGAMAGVASFKSCTGTGVMTNSSISCAAATGFSITSFPNGQTVTVSTGPTFTIALNSNTSPTKQLVMGTTGVSLASFDFTDSANIEPIKITDLTITQNTGASVNQQFRNLTLWNGAAQIAGPISLSSAAPSYSAVFSGMGTTIVVPQGGIATLTLKGDVPSFADGCGGSSTCTGLENTTSTFQVGASSTASTVALGADSNAAATHSSGTPISNAFTILRSKLTITGASQGSTSGRTRQSNDYIGNLTMSAASSYQVTVNTITLKFEGQAVSNGTAISVDLIDPSTNTRWGGAGAASTCTTGPGNSCTASFSFSSANSIGAGTSKALRLQVNSSNFFNAGTVSDSVSITIKNNTDVDWGDGSTTTGLSLDSVDVGTGIVISSVSYE